MSSRPPTGASSGPRIDTFEELRQRMAAWLVEFRLREGMKQRELGEAVGLSDKQISNIERGARGAKLESWLQFANVLHVSIVDFFQPRPAEPRVQRAGEPRGTYGARSPRGRAATPAQIDRILRRVKRLDEEAVDLLIKHAQALEDARKARGA